MNTRIAIIVLVIVLVGAGVWFWQGGPIPGVSPTPTASSQTYKNDQYGFSIALPDSWKGYTVLNSQWQGWNIITGEVVTSGPIITLRHPQWTTANPREDILVMVFTPDQWALVQQEKISLGAAPIPPSLLGQNSKYIMALPARYNYDFKTGFEEVDQLVHTLKAFEPATAHSSQSPVACTQEAKQCPNGSYVSRTGPNCEFTACPGDGTLVGHVTIGPNCPVEQVGNPCTPTPQAYTSRQVSIYKSDSTTLVTTQNFDTQGNYNISLPVGTYVVKSRTGISSIASIVGTITIKIGQTTTLNFNIDTGIR